MHKLIEYVCDELDTLEKKAANGGLSVTELQLADTLAHLKKNLLKGDEMMDGGEYSGAMYPDGRGSYRYGNDGSMARGRGANAPRDRMGRYSSEGYSRAADDALSKMHEMMRTAPDEQTRGEVQRMINRLEQM